MLEKCSMCGIDATPWAYVQGCHICGDCYYANIEKEFLDVQWKERKKHVAISTFLIMVYIIVMVIELIIAYKSISLLAAYMAGAFTVFSAELIVEYFRLLKDLYKIRKLRKKFINHKPQWEEVEK